MPGVTTKLGLLTSTDFCAWLKGSLDELITYLKLRSSNELSLGNVLALFTWLLGWVTCGKAELTPWVLLLTAQGEVLITCASVLSPWEVPAWGEWGNDTISLGVSATTCWDCLWATYFGELALTPWELVLTAGREVLITWASLPSAQEVPTWGGMVLSPWESVPLPACISCELPACKEAMLTPLVLVLAAGEETLVAWAPAHSTWGLGEVLIAWASVHSAWGGTALSSWEGLPAWRLPACVYFLPF